MDKRKAISGNDGKREIGDKKSESNGKWISDPDSQYTAGIPVCIRQL